MEGVRRDGKGRRGREWKGKERVVSVMEKGDGWCKKELDK